MHASKSSVFVSLEFDIGSQTIKSCHVSPKSVFLQTEGIGPLIYNTIIFF